jgi:hypothetical protein
MFNASECEGCTSYFTKYNYMDNGIWEMEVGMGEPLH